MQYRWLVKQNMDLESCHKTEDCEGQPCKKVIKKNRFFGHGSSTFFVTIALKNPQFFSKIPEVF